MTSNGLHTGSLPGPETITRVQLENGIVVLVYENFAAQSVVIDGEYNAGALHETPEKSGLANMTASALLRGTTQRDFDALASALEDVGADVGFGGGMHHAEFGGKALAEDLPLLVDIVADALRNPVFPDVQIERMRGEMMAGLMFSQQDTRYRARRAFREALYPAEHPYHYGSRGTLETIPNISPDDLRAFHARHYGPQGLVIVVVGAVKAAEAVDIVRERLGDWRNPTQPAAPALPPLAPPAEVQRVAVSIPGKSQSDIVMGVPGPQRQAPEWRAAVMANSVLGQFGMFGRIGDVVREKHGLAYYAYSSIEGGHGPGAWSVSAGVNPANIDLAVESIVGEIGRIVSEVVTDEDIAENKSFFTGQLPLQLESNEGLAGSILNMESYNLGLDHLQRYAERINALSKDDLLAAAQRYLTPDAYVLAVAGP